MLTVPCHYTCTTQSNYRIAIMPSYVVHLKCQLLSSNILDALIESMCRGNGRIKNNKLHSENPYVLQ